MERKRCLIYCRVSTDEQVSNYSLPNQLAGCRKYAADHGFDIVAELSEDCSGTIPIRERPQGKIMYDYVDNGEIDAIIMYTHDRTARDERVLEYMIFKYYIIDRGVELHYCDSGIDKDSDDGQLIGYIKAYTASRERSRILARTMEGRNSKAKSKVPVMSGHPPYGYRREGKGSDARLFIYEPEAQIVRNIFEWYVTGDNGNGPLSLNAIAQKLDTMGAPTPHYRKNAAEHWIPATIHYLMLNEMYAGITYYGKTRIIKKKRVKMPRENWIEIPVPDLQLVDRDVYNSVVMRAKHNQERARRNRKYRYLLSGYFTCGECGSAVVGTSGYHKGYLSSSYRCGNHWRKLEHRECKNINRSINAEMAEAAVWNWLVNVIEDEDTLRAGLQEMANRSASELEPKRQRLEWVKTEFENIDKKIRRLITTLGDEEDQTIIDALKDQTRILSKQKETLNDERQRLECELSQVQLAEEVQEQIIKRVAQIRRNLELATYEQKRELFNTLDLHVVFYDNEEGRRLGVSCGIAPDGVEIGLYPSSRFFLLKRGSHSPGDRSSSPHYLQLG